MNPDDLKLPTNERERAPVHIVVAEDDRSYLRMLDRILQRAGYVTHTASNGEDAWALLMQTEARLLVTDWTMPGTSGVDLCRRVRSAPLPYYVYSIVLTSRNEKREVVQGLSSGADDYMTKPVNPPELRARLRVGERIVRLETELRDAKSKLEIMVSTDELTGVSNRRALISRLGAELAQARRSGTDLSVAMIDIDRFKRLNDTYGHGAGDLVLRQLVDCILDAKREYDVVGRLGGEEFVVILPGLSLEDALPVAERLRAHVADAAFRLPDGTDLGVTFSAGVACARGGRVETLDALLAAADRALYRAKEGGRNRVEPESDADGTEAAA